MRFINLVVVVCTYFGFSSDKASSYTLYTNILGTRSNRLTQQTERICNVLVSASVVNGDTSAVNNPIKLEADTRLSLCEKARTVTSMCRSGTLCTVSSAEGIEGAPFGSFVDYVLDDEGNPVFLTNEMSMHTINIKESPNSMVTLFAQLKSPGFDSRGQDVSRCSVTGVIEKCSEELGTFEDKELIRLRYSLKHAYADRVMDSPKFHFYRLIPTKIFFVGGFGVTASWVPVDEYRTATPDILSIDCSSIVAKLNHDHVEDLSYTASHVLELENVRNIKVTNVDRLGMDFRVTRQISRVKLITEEFRVGFRIPVYTVEDAKSEILKIFQEAWEKGQGLNEEEEDEDSIPVMKTAVQILE